MYDVLVAPHPDQRGDPEARDRHRRRLDRPRRRRDRDVAPRSAASARSRRRSTRVGDDYDFICIDTPPSLGLLTINALTASDKVIVPVQCEYLSMRGLLQLQNTLEMIRENLNPRVEIEGILPTMLDSRTVHAKEAVEILEENFGELVFKSRIRKAIKFAEAPVRGASVLKYDPEEQRRRLLPGACPGGPDSWRVRKRASMREGPARRPLPLDRRARGSARGAGARRADEAETGVPRRTPPRPDARRPQPPATEHEPASARRRRARRPRLLPRAGRRRARAAGREGAASSRIFADDSPTRRPRLRPRRAGLRLRVRRRSDAARAGDPRRRRRRRRRQRDQPDGRGRDPRGRVHGGQHRPSVASAVGRRRHRPHRQRR